RFLHGHGTAEFHRQAVPEMVPVGHGLEQIHAGLVLQGYVAFHFRQQLLLELEHGALALEEVADEKQGETAKAKKSHTQGPLVADGMEKHERIHERSKPADKHEH